MATTNDNLHEAFAGESQANRSYTSFAEQAEKDGLPGVAKLFRAVAAAEAIHAAAHLKAVGGVKKTAENLAHAMAGEKHEFTEMYPPMLATAEADGNKRAARSMRYAMEVEKVHFELYSAALAKVQAGGDLGEVSVKVCPTCGHTVIGDAPEECPICNASAASYIEIA
jgi:rubrerythrin